LGLGHMYVSTIMAYFMLSRYAEILDCACTHNIECSFDGWFIDGMSSEV